MHNNYSVSLGTKHLVNFMFLLHSIAHSSTSQYATYGGRRRLSRMSSILWATQ